MTERYQIIKLLDKDQAGGRYLAEDTTLERNVVFRHIEFASDVAQTKEWKKSFSTFSGKLCALQHPNIVTIYDVAIDEDGPNMVTQYVEGESLAERLKQGPLKQMGVFKMAEDLLEALHAAHQSGVFHGALHTGSVKRLSRATGGHRYLIVDLGLNNLASMAKGEDVHIADPVLLAPELHNDENEPDAKADIFMLGQLCYTALAGGHPFAENSPERCAEAHLAGELPSLIEFAPDVQADFAAWVMQLCVGDPTKRITSVQDAMVSLQEITIDEPVPNVAGVTQAIVVEQPRATTALVTVPILTESDSKATVLDPFSEAEKKSVKKVAILAACLCLLIAVGLWFGMKRGDADRGTGKPDGAMPSVPAGVLVHLHKTEIVNTLVKRTEPVLLSLDSEDALDWTVVTGAPASKERVQKEEGRYIQSILTSGDYKEYALKNSPIKYTLDDKDILAMAATNTKPHKAKVGEGWETILRIPPKHKGSVIVTFYMLQAHCDFKIIVVTPEGKEPVQFKLPHGDPGVVKIPIELVNPKSGGFFTIKILADSKDEAKGFTMGISAIQVERR